MSTGAPETTVEGAEKPLMRAVVKVMKKAAVAARRAK